MTTTPCPHCHLTFRHGERNACCSGCGRAFSGQSAFDRHQHIGENGTVCADPAALVTKHGERVYKPAEIGPKAENGTIWTLAPVAGRENPWVNPKESADD